MLLWVQYQPQKHNNDVQPYLSNELSRVIIVVICAGWNHPATAAEAVFTFIMYP
jgi:hypothetical protein